MVETGKLERDAYAATVRRYNEFRQQGREIPPDELLNYAWAVHYRVKRDRQKGILTRLKSRFSRLR
jgi:hypothetical protein